MSIYEWPPSSHVFQLIFDKRQISTNFCGGRGKNVKLPLETFTTANRKRKPYFEILPLSRIFNLSKSLKNPSNHPLQISLIRNTITMTSSTNPDIRMKKTKAVTKRRMPIDNEIYPEKGMNLVHIYYLILIYMICGNLCFYFWIFLE